MIGCFTDSFLSLRVNIKDKIYLRRFAGLFSLFNASPLFIRNKPHNRRNYNQLYTLKLVWVFRILTLVLMYTAECTFGSNNFCCGLEKCI